MAVKQGYKQTEVGVIPEDWDVKSVSEFAQIKTGPFGTLLKASEYAGNDGVPLISVGEVGFGRFKVTEHTPLVPEAVVRRLPQYLLRIGDIVFGRKGAVERSALVTDKEDGWFLGSDGINIRPQRECYPPYLACQFQRYEVQSWLLHNATGTTMASLNQAILGKVQIPYAPLAEQTAIATALSDADALIESLEQLIHKKRQIKQGAMQELLTGKKRLPGFVGEWEWKAIEQLEKEGLLRLSRGKVISKSDIENNPGDYPIYSSSVHNDGLFGNYGEFMFDEELITWSVDGGGHFFYRSRHKFSVTNVCGFMRVDRKLSCAFVAFQLQLLHGNQSYDYMSKAHPSVIRKAYTLGLPSHEEQTAIATILSDMDAELAALEEKLNKARAVKQGMMQELLTGRVRLV